MAENVHAEAYNMLQTSKDFFDGKLTEDKARELMCQQIFQMENRTVVFAEMQHGERFPADFPKAQDLISDISDKGTKITPSHQDALADQQDPFRQQYVSFGTQSGLELDDDRRKIDANVVALDMLATSKKFFDGEISEQEAERQLTIEQSRDSADDVLDELASMQKPFHRDAKFDIDRTKNYVAQIVLKPSREDSKAIWTDQSLGTENRTIKLDLGHDDEAGRSFIHVKASTFDK